MDTNRPIPDPDEVAALVVQRQESMRRGLRSRVIDTILAMDREWAEVPFLSDYPPEVVSSITEELKKAGWSVRQSHHPRKALVIRFAKEQA